MKLIENEAVDFICAVMRFAGRHALKDPDKPGMVEIEKWCEEAERNLSPFLLNDLDLLAGKMIAPIIYLWSLAFTDDGLKTGEDLLAKLRSADNNDFVSGIEKVHGLKPEDITSPGRVLDVISDDGLYPNNDPKEEAELIYRFLRDPVNLQNQLHKTYAEFYEKAYLPGRNSLSSLREEKFRWHEERLANDKEEYLLSLGMKEFIKEILDMGEPRLYLSLFADTDVTAIMYKQVIIIGCGTDKLITAQSARDKASHFLSCTGDPKRLEILRLTAQRPWYSTELARHFDLKPATLSYHIAKLVEADLITLTKGEQRRFYYSLNKETVKEYLGFLKEDLLGESD